MSRIVDILAGTWDSGTTKVRHNAGNGKFTDSPVMNEALEDYKKMGQKKKGKIKLWLPSFNN